MNVLELASEFKQAIYKVYGEKLAQVILYGSWARGEATENSDVDLAIVLREEPAERWREIERIYPVVSQLSDKYNQLIAPIVLAEQRLLASQNLFIRNLRQEGIVL